MAEKQKLQDQDLRAVSGGSDGGEGGMAAYCPKCCSYKNRSEYHDVGSGCHTKTVCNTCGTEMKFVNI